jgi:hypothetical protein
MSNRPVKLEATHVVQSSCFHIVATSRSTLGVADFDGGNTSVTRLEHELSTKITQASRLGAHPVTPSASVVLKDKPKDATSTAHCALIVLPT